MLFEMKMPKLTETLEDVEILRLLVKKGERIKKGQVICEVETDKATVEVESLRDGVVQTIFFTEGDEVPVNAVIMTIDESAD